MSRFYRIQISNIFLTKSGTNTGGVVWCETDVTGADSLLMPVSGTTTIAVDGSPIQQTFATGTKGKTIEIKITRLYKNVFDSIVAIINNSLVTGAVINIKGTNSDLGDFDLDFLPLLPRPFDAKEFDNLRLKDVVLRFVCAE